MKLCHSQLTFWKSQNLGFSSPCQHQALPSSNTWSEQGAAICLCPSRVSTNQSPSVKMVLYLFESCVGCFVRQTVRGVTVSCWHGGVEVTVWLETIPWQAPLCHPSQSALELRTVPPGTSLPPARPQRPEQLTPLIYLPLLVWTFSNLHYQLAWSPPITP